MFDLLLDVDAVKRLDVFLVVFAVFSIWQVLAPRRKRSYPKSVRWLNNLSISLINIIATRLSVPVTLVFVASIAESSNLGLLNLIELPAILSIVLALLLLDFAIYAQHIIFHKVHFL